MWNDLIKIIKTVIRKYIQNKYTKKKKNCINHKS